MLFSLTAHFVRTHTVKSQIRIQPQRVKGFRMEFFHIFLNILQSNTADPAYGSGKILIDHLFGDTYRLKDLGSLVGLDRGDSHFRRNLYDSTQYCMIIVFYCRIIVLVQHVIINQLPDGFLGKIRIDCTCTISQKSSKMMNLSGLSGFYDNSQRSTFLGFYQMMMHRGNCQKRRDRHMVLIYSPV